MQLPIQPGITVTMDAYTIRFSSRDEGALAMQAERFAYHRGMRDKGAIRSTRCNITPEPSNQEHNLGVPSAHMMILVSHKDLNFAGDREPQTTTIYRTLKFAEGEYIGENPRVWVDEPFAYYEFHFTAELK